MLLHTNLGRAPLPDRPATRSCRGRRVQHARVRPGEGRTRQAAGPRPLPRPRPLRLRRRARGQQQRSAVLLALSALGARPRRPGLARELVAIGGSFQIPEILEASGARLREVGTTNRTTIDDYRRAMTPEAALLLTVHPSNYEIRGYVRRPDRRELAALAREAGIPWVHDQGTGCVVPLDEFGVPDEPTVAQCLAGGADLVTFSGDKLFSGPQAGSSWDARRSWRAPPPTPSRAPSGPTSSRWRLSPRRSEAWKTGAWREFPVYRAASASVAELDARGRSIAERVPTSGRCPSPRPIARRVRWRNESRESVSVSGPRGRERDAIGGHPGGAAAGGLAADRGARGARQGTPRPALHRTRRGRHRGCGPRCARLFLSPCVG